MTQRLILFDIDGTLLRAQNSGRLSTRAAMLDVFGTEANIMAHQFGGKTDWFTLAELLTEHGYTAEMIGQQMNVYETALARHLETIILEHSTTAFPGALTAVNAFRQQPDSVVMGIVTGNCSTTAPIKLRAAGYDTAWFPVGAYGSEALERDDLPALALERAVQHTGWSLRPEQVIVVGDTPADIACARALGAVAVAVTTGYSSREALADADMILDDLAALPGIIATL
ncbi:MAG: HAD hydrolase-like protein [Anaerolineae bacterium]